MRRQHAAALLVFAATATWAPQAQAKDLRNRAGLGFNNQFGQYSSLTALSVRYGLPMPDPAINIQVELDFGLTAVNFDYVVNGFFTGGRVLYAFVVEDNMNLYGAIGSGLTMTENDVYVQIDPGLGVEFFLFGLENLGFAAEWGLTIALGDPTGISTFAASPGMGLHYYF